jgi:hypothetical protein
MNNRAEPYFENVSAGDPNSQDLGRFSRRYDLGAITPRAMVALSAELFVSGYLTRDQHADLSFQSELMPNFDLTIGALTGEKAEPDRPRDYAEIWRQRLEFEKNHITDDERIVKRTQKILDLLETIESQPTNSQALQTIENINQLNKNWEHRTDTQLTKAPLNLPPLSLKDF